MLRCFVGFKLEVLLVSIMLVFQLGIFLRVLRPACTVLRPGRFIQRPARIKIFFFFLQNAICCFCVFRQPM